MTRPRQRLYYSISRGDEVTTTAKLRQTPRGGGYGILGVEKKAGRTEQTSNRTNSGDQASRDRERSLTSVRRGKVRLPRLAAGAKGSFHALAAGRVEGRAGSKQAGCERQDRRN